VTPSGPRSFGSRRARAAWRASRSFAIVAVAVASACAHNPPATPELAAGAPLPRFCAADECAVIVSHNVDIESCECAARQYDETLGARLDLVFAVAAGGGKPQVTVGRAIGATESLQRCVVERAGGWSFPPPAGGAQRFRTGIIFAPDDHGACPPGPNASVRRATASKERIRAALAARQEEVKACYQKAAGNAAASPGRVVVTLIFNRDGRVIQAQIDEATIHDERVEACITDKAYAWLLPRPSPPGVVTVSYPYSFAADAAPTP
jgi:hypothetical protein